MPLMLRRPLPIGIDENDDIGFIPRDSDEAPDIGFIPRKSDASPLGNGLSSASLDSPVAPKPISAAPVAAPVARAPIGNPKLEADQTELGRLQRSGSGIDQITHPVDAQGNPTGQKVGIGKKILGGLARVGDVALGTMFPAAAVLTPGTTLHHQALLGQANNRVATDIKNEQEQAQTRNLEMQPEILQARMDNEAAKRQNDRDKLAVSLRSHGFKQDEQGNIVPLGYEEMSEEQQAVHDLKVSQQEVADARKAYIQAQKDNMPKAMEMAQQRIATANANARTAAAKLGLQQQEFERDTFGTVNGAPIPGGPTINGQPVGTKIASASKQDQSAFDKAYVKPARDVEKSYQMMNQAYNEYKAAKAQGKELPTGAQSMLALSTHLSTTFGNVKGSRITKDMIEHHLGARGISDSATVAVQRLTNGDTLSPAQWDAFHDLIKQSRDLSWKGATTEAQRKHLPVDFLPEDLQGGGGQGQPKPTHKYNPQTQKIESF